MESPVSAQQLEHGQLLQLKRVSLVEAFTLVVLLFVAVPMKHLAGWPVATAIVGPIHGLAFLLYVWTVLETVTGGGWTRSEIARLLVAALIPFGGLTNLALLRRKAEQLTQPTRPA